MTSPSSEKVQYDIEVLIKGLSQLQQLNQQLQQLNAPVSTTGSSPAQVAQQQTNALNQSAQTNTKVTTKQTQATGSFQAQLTKATKPLRTFGQMVSLLNPTTALAALGLGSVSAALKGLSDGYDRQIALISSNVGAINLNTTAQTSYRKELERSLRESKEFGVSQTDIEKAYGTLAPNVRDMAVAQGILSEAVTVHKDTGIELQTVVQEMNRVFNEGKFVMDEFGGSVLQGEKAVKIVSEEMRRGSSAAVRYKTAMDDASSQTWDQYIRKAKTAAGWTVSILKLAAVDFFSGGSAGTQAILAAEKAKQDPREAAIIESVSGIEETGPALHSARAAPRQSLQSRRIPKFAKGGIVTKPTIAEIGEEGPEAVVPLGSGGGLNFAGVQARAKEVFSSLPREMWRSMADRWDIEVQTPLWNRLQSLFRGDRVRDTVREVFVEVPKSVGNFITGGWDALVNLPFFKKLEEMFSWGSVKALAELAFVKLPGEIWGWLSAKWDELVKTPFLDKLGELFNWDGIREKIQGAFGGVPVAIWNAIVEGWNSHIWEPFVGKLDELFSWDNIKEKLRVAFIDTPVAIWNAIVEGWNRYIWDPFMKKLDELFDWDNIKEKLRTAFVDTPIEIWRSIVALWEEVLAGQWWAKIGEMFNWDSIKTILKLAFLSTPLIIWDSIKALWDSALSSKWWAKIGEIFNWESIKTILKLVFLSTPLVIWDAIVEFWEGALASQWWAKIGEMFSWESVKTILKLVFVQAPSAIWNAIMTMWDGALSSKWWAKIGEMFSWESIKTWVLSAFEGVGGAIWSVLGPAIDDVLGLLNTAWSVVTDIIVAPFRDAVNRIQSILDSIQIPSFSFNVPIIGGPPPQTPPPSSGGDDDGDDNTGYGGPPNEDPDPGGGNQGGGSAGPGASGGAAWGTQNARGGRTLVGERGPEIVDLPPHSRVYANDRTRGMLRQNIRNLVERPTLGMSQGQEFFGGGQQQALAGSSQPIELNVYIDGRKFERFVVDSLDRRVRLRGGQ